VDCYEKYDIKLLSLVGVQCLTAYLVSLLPCCNFAETSKVLHIVSRSPYLPVSASCLPRFYLLDADSIVVWSQVHCLVVQQHAVTERMQHGHHTERCYGLIGQMALSVSLHSVTSDQDLILIHLRITVKLLDDAVICWIEILFCESVSLLNNAKIMH